MNIYPTKFYQDNKFYVYMYLREKDSINGLAGTPYYIGKGTGDRLTKKHQKGISVPKDKHRIQCICKNMNESLAIQLEIYLIQLFGRIDNGTGILRNRTDGGEGGLRKIWSEESKQKVRENTPRKYGADNPMYGVHRFGIDNPMYEKFHPNETRQKIKENRGSTYGDKNGMFGKKGELNPRFGKPLPRETIEKVLKTKRENGIRIGLEKGRIHIHNKELSVAKMIPKEYWPMYEKRGFKKGRLPKK